MSDLEIQLKIQQKALNQLRHRMVVLENRIEEYDKIKMKRPSVYTDVKELPMLHMRVELWKHKNVDNGLPIA